MRWLALALASPRAAHIARVFPETKGPPMSVLQRRTGVLAIALWIAAMAGAEPANAQPTLDSLWPNADGTTWHFEFAVTTELSGTFTSPATLAFNGSALHHGHDLQILEDSHDVPPGAQMDAPDLPPLIRAIWRARPDLRDALEERYSVTRGAMDWWPLLLHGGFFQENPASFQMWQPDWNHPTWTYLQLPLQVGASFTQQLLPELTDDVFLHGTVESIDAVVSTIAGTFTNAVKMNYVIDYGTSEVRDGAGLLIGTTASETRGHVHYVPEIGPVEMLEEFIPYLWMDCGASDCPEEWLNLVGVIVQTITLSMTENPTALESVSWGATKALHR